MNAFEKMMSTSGKRNTSTPTTSAGGRPMHESWSGFKKIYIRGNIAAKCLNCMKALTNTAQSRLLNHR